MATDEEYLDNLLKSLTENEGQSETIEDAELVIEDMPEDLAALFNMDENASSLQPEVQENNDSVLSTGESSFGAEASMGAEELMAAFQNEMWDTEETTVSDVASGAEIGDLGDAGTDDWQNGLDALLAQAEEQIAESDVEFSDLSAADLFGATNTNSSEDELKELDGLLNDSEQSTAVDDDMLALLESMKADTEEEEEVEEADSFALFGTSSKENTEAKESAEDKKAKKKRTKKEKKRTPFWKKNKEESAEKADEAIGEAAGEGTEGVEAQEEFAIVEDILALTDEVAGEESETVEEKTEAKEKKPGFFTRMINALTEEEEEEATEDENHEGDGEAEDDEKPLSKKEEKQKKKEEKKKKKEEKKKGKKGKEAKEGEEENGDSQDEEAVEEDPKKKAKREKKEQKRLQREQEKALAAQQPKVLTKKKMMVLVAASATLTAGIIALSTFLPEYVDKNYAREAFYEGDYETVYKLLYDKNLNASDSLLYNRAKTVLKMERKIESYHNNLAMNREVEAIDALLQGISSYQTMVEADEYGVRSEIDALYQEICGILESNYGITIEDALEINAYDNATYTRRLHSLVDGTEFVKPGKEEVPAEPLPPQDILADEEEIISY